MGDQNEQQIFDRQQLLEKKVGTLDLIEELRISIDTTYTLKNVIQQRMNEIEIKLDEKDNEIVKLREEFIMFRGFPSQSRNVAGCRMSDHFKEKFFSIYIKDLLTEEPRNDGLSHLKKIIVIKV